MLDPIYHQPKFFGSDEKYFNLETSKYLDYSIFPNLKHKEDLYKMK